MSLIIEKLKKYRLLIQIISLPVWVVVSVLVLGVSLWGLDKSVPPAPLSSNLLADSSSAQSYRLFAALPKPKAESVLGQRVNYADYRVKKLQQFFNFYRSPLESEVLKFVQVADEYGIPWTLMPAIACKESGCGRVIPYGSYNPFGWAVYSGQNSGTNFTSWAEAIERVGRGLREDYLDQGYTTVAAIETKYTPQSANTHNNWRDHVEYFMNELENWEIGGY